MTTHRPTRTGFELSNATHRVLGLGIRRSKRLAPIPLRVSPGFSPGSLVRDGADSTSPGDEPVPATHELGFGAL
jgi:hypothetical protein